MHKLKRQETSDLEYIRTQIETSKSIHPELSISKSLIFKETEFTSRKTKIICTLGPSCRKVEDLVSLLDAGMNVARMNFSHGDHSYHRETVQNLREALKLRPKLTCALMLDTKGPEIRTGLVEDKNGVTLVKGQDLELTTDYSFVGNNKKVAISYPQIIKLSIGQVVLMADGNLSALVKEIKADCIIVTLQNDYVLGNTKNVFLPKVSVELPTLSEKDEKDLVQFGLKEGVDMIAASFVRKAEDVEYIRDVLGPKGSHIKIISKIENHEGIDNYEEILNASDGIMVARGDLGMELPVEKVFLAQKYMIQLANKAGKPIITATQMLESMVKNSRPTRAEATDVANAVLDGTDAVMLSGETANGLFPIESVMIMAKICVEAELCINYQVMFKSICDSNLKPLSTEEALCISAVSAANDTNAGLIIVITESGHIARLMSKYRPKQPILALCMSSSVIRQMNISRGIYSLKIPSYIDTHNLIQNAIKHAIDNGHVKTGDKVVCISGQNESSPENVNILKVMTI